MSEEFKQRVTENVEKKLELILDEMPSEAKYARVIDKDNCSIGGLGTVSCWTSHSCKYTTEDGETVKVIPITTHSSRFEGRDTLNFLLYQKGLLKLRYDDEYRQIRNSYEGEVDAGIINPINNLHSPKSRFKRICDYIVNDTESASVKLTFVCDYDYAETEIKFRLSDEGKREYAIRAKIEYKGQQHTTRPMHYTTVSILLGEAYEQLTGEGVEVIVAHDMKKDDEEFMRGHHNQWWS